jgi:hypothetical protein
MSKVDWSVRVVDIVEIGIRECGRSCEEHDICGCVVNPDILVRFIKEEIMVKGKIEVVTFSIHLSISGSLIHSFS